MKPSITFSRPLDLIEKLAKRALQIKQFTNQCAVTLENNTDKLNLFLASAKATDLEIGNMYSTGIQEETYVEGCEMIAHCKMVLSATPKNIKLVESRLQEKWAAIFEGKEISANFNYYKIKDNVVLFQIWIKPAVTADQKLELATIS